VKDITVTLTNVTIEEIPDNRVHSNLPKQDSGCTAAIQNSGGRKTVGFLQAALKADATYTVILDEKNALDAKSSQALLKDLAIQLGAKPELVSNNEIKGYGLYWGVKPPVAELVKTPTTTASQPRGFDTVQIGLDHNSAPPVTPPSAPAQAA
jgi:hypothetical protein